MRVALLLSPVLFLVVAELVVRVVAPRASDEDPFLSLSGAASKFGEVEVDGVRYYRVQHADLYAKNNVHFRVEKVPGTLRVFCVGGSASAGWPHEGGQTWSKYLEDGLRGAFPGRAVEVLNVSAHAYASYRVRPIFEDVVRFQPDLMVLWSGNNEFVERRTYAASVGAQRLVRGVAKVSRLFELLLGTVLSGGEKVSLPDESREAAAFLFAQFEQLALELRADPVQFAAVVDHYGFTVEAMIDAARSHDVPLLVLTVPSNLRDWHPNVSRHGVEGEALARWRAEFKAGARDLLDGDASSAVGHLAAARAADPVHAETAFLYAHALEVAGHCDDARPQYVAARDLDMTPFRAISLLNDRLRGLATSHPQVTLVDLEQELFAAARSCAPGFDLFLDYVHPTRAGNLEIARRVFDAILARDLLNVAPADRSFARADDGYDETKDVSVRLHVLYLLYHMHQEQAYRDQADGMITVLTSSGADPETDPLIALLREGRDGIDAFLTQRARALHGDVVPADYEAAHQQWYRTHFQRIQEVVTAARNKR